MINFGSLEKDGYLFNTIFRYLHEPKEALYIDKELSHIDIEYINKNKIDKFLFDNSKESIKDMRFMLSIDNVIYLEIDGYFDQEVLHKLNKLKFLGVSHKMTYDIDMSAFTQLEAFSLYVKNIVKNLKDCKSIKSLLIYNFYIPGKDLSILDQIKHLTQLDTLYIHNTDITNLNFLEGMKIQRLILRENKYLSDIQSLVSMKDTLKSLQIILSKKITNLHVISNLSKLVYFEMSYGPMIDNLDFLKNLNELKTCKIESTTIIDGNLNVLMRLQKSSVYPIKKHYFVDVDGQRKKPRLETFPFGARDFGDDQIDFWRRIYHA